MKIIELKIKKLHGILNKTIHFNSGVNFLVGINGSGKTSILNIINWLLKPSIVYLTSIEFKSINLKFTLDDNDYEIICIQTSEILTLTLNSKTDAKVKKFIPIVASLPHNLSTFRKNSLDRKAELLSANFTPDPPEIPLWNFLESLSKPINIGISRDLIPEMDDRLKLRKKNLKGNATDFEYPIEEVKKILRNKFTKEKNSISVLSKKLRKNLFLALFNQNIRLSNNVLNKILSDKIDFVLLEKKLSTIHSKVMNYIRNYEKDQYSNVEVSKIESHFRRLRRLLPSNPKSKKNIKNDVFYIFNLLLHLKNYQKILKYFNDFETNVLKIKKDMDLFLEALNKLYYDSRKKIHFDEETNELIYDILDKTGNAVLIGNDLSTLSAGEKHLIILFSYIQNYSAEKKVFLIDEPEISIHVWWQENLLRYLTQFNKSNSQIIFATHSPILINDYQKNIIPLLPYNDSFPNN